LARVSFDRCECAYPRVGFLRDAHQSGQQRFVDVELTAIVGDVAFAMRLIDDSPLLRWEREGMLETLEDDVAILGSIGVPAKRGQCQRVCGVVCEVESAVDVHRAAV
jgi:hypothetical protein